MSQAQQFSGLDLAAIDAFLEGLGSATNDDHMRQLFNTYNATYDTEMPADPFSAEYRPPERAHLRHLTRGHPTRPRGVGETPVSVLVRLGGYGR
jgi:hypothetical protein